MTRKPASKETIRLLIENASKSIADAEQLLREVELTKSRITDNDTSENYIHLIFELLSGSLLGIHETYSCFKNMISSDSVYVKRYNMQMINLSQFEWCKYLNGKDRKGILANLINYHNNRHLEVPILREILKKVCFLGKQCNVGLRTMTAHYDKPGVMYSKLLALNDEDVYARRIGDQLLIHDMILKYTSTILQNIITELSSDNIGHTSKVEPDDLNIQELVNTAFSNAFNRREELSVLTNRILSIAWDNIDLIKKMLDRCDKAIAFMKAQQFDYVKLSKIKALTVMRLAVSFMEYDLVCSMSSYLNASSNMERSVCLMRIYRIETGALTHLYGYNDVRGKDSIWSRLELIPEFITTPPPIEIVQSLDSLTSHLDQQRRNLYTHYREVDKSNISERWQYAEKMDHVKESMHVLKLFELCRNIGKYLQILISAMSTTDKSKTDKLTEMICNIKELARKNDLDNIVSMSDKLLSIFTDN